MAQAKKQSKNNGANVDYEAELWQMADALRGSMDAAEYKHVVLGLIFLKYISDAFEEQHAKLEAEKSQGADPEDPDEYRALSIFWVPPEARWSHLKAQAKQATIGQLVDDAMSGIERDNASLKGVLPKDYARPALDKHRLGQLIDLISNIRIGDAEGCAKDVLGRVYEHFVSQFASTDGKKGGEFYTPRSVVKLLVEMIEPYNGRVYDRCCSSSGMFVQSVEFTSITAVTAMAGKLGAISASTAKKAVAWHRRPDRPRRHFSQRPPSRSQGRLILANPPRQPQPSVPVSFYNSAIRRYPNTRQCLAGTDT
jgi:type I restriction enzyme M protein